MGLFAIILSTIGLFAFTQQDYQLKQEIKPITCMTTTIPLNTMNVTWQSTCDESYVPTLTEILTDNGRLILRGRFDASQMRTFKINIFGAWYQLGVSTHLTASGNDWTLDLTHIRSTIVSGTYTIVLELLTLNDFFYQGTYHSDIIFPSTDSPVPIDDESPRDEMGRSDGWLVNTGQNIILVVGIGLALFGIAILLTRKSHSRRVRR